MSNATLGLLFLVVGTCAAGLMYYLWRFPYDKVNRKSSAPRSLMLLHRCLGYVFVAIYVVMMSRMLPRLWEYKSLSVPAVFHALFGVAIGLLLIVKITILRFFRQYEEAMPYLGSGVLAFAWAMAFFPAPIAFREWQLSQALAAPESAVRVAAAVAARPDFFAPADGVAVTANLGTGRGAMLSACAQCHGLPRIFRKERDGDEWIELVTRMAKHSQRLAAIPDRERALIAAYLIAVRSSAPMVANAEVPEPAATAAVPAHASAPSAPVAVAATGSAWNMVAGIFAANCTMCHSGPKAQNGVRLDTLANALSDRSGAGSVVVAGDPAASELYRRITGESAPRMPISGPPYLSDEETGVVRKWIEGIGDEAGVAASEVAAAGSAIAAAPAAAVVSDSGAISAPTWVHVKPILAMNCMRCHTQNGVRGAAPEGLLLTSLDGVLRGAERAVVIPRNPAASPLLRHVKGFEEPRMPFDGPPYLTADETALIELWIARGAPDEKGVESPAPVGRMVRLEGRLTREWAVDDIPFKVAEDARVRDVSVGSNVEIRATVQADGSLLADSVRGR